jgi:hypothetical protein
VLESGSLGSERGAPSNGRPYRDIEEVTANSDNIAEGELVYVRDGIKMAQKA